MLFSSRRGFQGGFDPRQAGHHRRVVLFDPFVRVALPLPLREQIRGMLPAVDERYHVGTHDLPSEGEAVVHQATAKQSVTYQGTGSGVSRVRATFWIPWREPRNAQT